MTRLPSLLRRLPVALAIGVLAIAVACGGDDAPTPQPTISITPQDEQGIDKAIADVTAALQQRTTTALDALANDKLRAKPEQLDKLATCFPVGGSLSVRNRDLKPSTGAEVRATINFTVTQDGKTENARRDWRFDREADGSFKLNTAPDCPFRRVVPSANPGEATAASGSETPVDGVVTQTAPPVQP